MREQGYYWIKYFGEWEIGHWNTTHKFWTFGDKEYSYQDSELDMINEARLIPPN